MSTTLAVALFQTTTLASTPVASAAGKLQSCGGTQFIEMTGRSSILAIRSCTGGNLYGIGTSADEAIQNLNGFMAVKEAGISCSAGASGVYTGPFNTGTYANFTCNGRPTIAVGSTPTIAANNVLELAVELAASGAHCSAGNTSYYPESHGFRFSYNCTKSGNAGWSVNGLGSSIDDANSTALRVVRFTAQNPGGCMFSPASLNGAIFSTTFVCNRSHIQGYGSSVSSAAADALTQIGAK